MNQNVYQILCKRLSKWTFWQKDCQSKPFIQGYREQFEEQIFQKKLLTIKNEITE